ncbi:MAG TPA: hypothetical protein VKA78_01690, partial [Pyrinomonadaceae bacterium]|nr:hypothetical protein [Pyrinomonadaceae bacterium]
MAEQVSPLVLQVFADEPTESLQNRIRAHAEELLISRGAQQFNRDIHVAVEKYPSEPNSSCVRFEFGSEMARNISVDLIVPWLFQTYKAMEINPSSNQSPNHGDGASASAAISSDSEAETVEPFPSLEKLMTAHAALLQQEAPLQEGLDPQFRTKVKEFIKRGTQSGKRLDDTDERRTAQSLLNYWVTVLYRIDSEPPPDAILDYYAPPAERGFDESQCPYIGLSPFTEEDKDSFFGRDSLIDVIVGRLQEKRLVVLVGPSGGGKTSVLKAGVLPRLKNDRDLESTHWTYLPPFTPGSEPLLSLARTIKDDDKQTAERLLQQPQHLRELLNDPSFDGKPCVLVIDQFEELFTFCKDDTRRKAFLDALFTLRESPIKHRVILSMRSDQVNHLIRRPELNEVFRESEIRLYPMKEAELLDVIKKPAEKIDLKFQSGLIEQLLREIYGDPVGLPLLQFVLLELWAQRECDTITWAAMNRLGSCRDGLVSKADQLYTSLNVPEKETMRRIFLRMVRLSDTWEAATEPVRLEDLYRAGENRTLVNSVLVKLLQANLARISNVSCRGVGIASGEVSCELPAEISADYQFELAHQTLARYWPEAIQWFNKLRESLVVKRRLELYSGNWGILGHGEQGLLDKYQVHEADTWLNSEEAKELGYDPDVVTLVALSKKVMRREKWLRLASWAAIAIVVVIVIVVAFWVDHRRLKEQTSLRLALQADSLKSKQLDLALLLNLEAIHKHSSGSNVNRPLEKTLMEVVSYSPTLRAFLYGQDNGAKQLVFSNDSKTIFTLDDSGQIIRSWSVESHARLEPIQTPAAKTISTYSLPLLSPGGRNLLFITQERALVNWDVGKKEQQTLFSLPQEINGAEDPVFAYSDDSRQIAWIEDGAGSAKGSQLSVLNLDTKKKVATSVERPQNIAFSPDKRTIATVNHKGEVILFAITDHETAPALKQVGKPLTCPSGGLSALTFPISFSADSQRLVVPCSTTKVVTWDLKNQRQLGTFERRSSSFTGLRTQAGSKGEYTGVDDYSTVTSFALSGSGQLLAVGYQDGSVVFWNANNQVSTEYPKAHSSIVKNISFCKDSKKLLTVSDKGQPLVWNKSESASEEVFEPPQELLPGLMPRVFSSVTVGPNYLVAAAGDAGPVVLWDLQQRVPGTKLSQSDLGTPGAFLPNLHAFLVNSQNQIVEFDLANATKVGDGFSLDSSQGFRGDVVFSRTGSIAAVRRFDETVDVWDLRAGQLMRKLQGERKSEAQTSSLEEGIALDNQGKKLALASKGKIEIWTLTDGSSITIDYSAADNSTLAFSGDGSKLAASDEKGSISVWDAATGKTGSMPFKTDSPSSKLEFTRDNSKLLSYTAENLSVWDFQSGTKALATKLRVSEVALNPVRDELAATVSDVIVILSLADGKEQLIVQPALITGNRSPLGKLFYSADGKSLLVGHVDGSVDWISLDATLLKQRAC